MEIFIFVLSCLAASACLCVVFSIKGKLLPVLGLRLVFSFALITVLALFRIMPLNALVVAATGLFGAPGLLASAVIIRFL